MIEFFAVAVVLLTFFVLFFIHTLGLRTILLDLAETFQFQSMSATDNRRSREALDFDMHQRVTIRTRKHPVMQIRRQADFLVYYLRYGELQSSPINKYVRKRS